MKYEAVCLKGRGPNAAVHLRTLEPVTSPRRSYYAGEILCNHRWKSEQFKPAPQAAVTCGNCLRRKAEIEEARRDSPRGGADRPYSQASIDELEKIFAQHTSNPGVLGRLLEELTYRKTDRAKQLRREVQGVIEGTVPTREPDRPPVPEDQISLLD